MLGSKAEKPSGARAHSNGDSIGSVAETAAQANGGRQAHELILGAAERRQLTVLFCDLVGSTQLAEELDPEDLRNILATYRSICSEIVARHDGTVMQYLGDGINVMFGYPVAYEHSTGNAVRAAIAMLEAINGGSPELSGLNVKLNLRIGINTGQVVVGSDGAGALGEQLSVIGDVPNLAARLQGVAQPGQIVVSKSTYTLTKQLFDFTELGAHALKGFSKPVTCYSVNGDMFDSTTVSTTQREKARALIGRNAELGLIRQHWSSAENGDGQVLMLSGEAGIGKSCILHSFNRQLADEDVTIVQFFGSAFHLHSTMHPIVEELQGRLGLHKNASAADKLSKLKDTLTLAQQVHLPALCYLIGIDTPATAELLALAPEELKKATFAAALEFYASMAEERPLLMEFEDVHWCDPTTLEIISLFIEQLKNKRWMLLLSFRPDYKPPFQNLSHVTSLSLNRFAKSDIFSLINAMTGGKPLPKRLVDQIVERADGIPLYAEELTQMVLESGWVRDFDGHYQMSGSNVEHAIPASLQDSLTARLDRSPSAKEVAQIAATIGRRFSHELLGLVSGYRDQQLRGALEQLLDAELIYRHGTATQISYEFKHALVQDAAYQSLLKTARRECHRRIALALEEHMPKLCHNEPESLGYHYAAGDEHQKALTYFVTAAERAMASSASLEAINHLENALAALAKTSQSDARDAQEFELLVMLAVPQAAALGYAHENVNRSYERAHELARKNTGNFTIFPVIYGLMRYHLLGARYADAFEHGENLWEMAKEADDRLMMAASHRAMGSARFYCGNPQAALEELYCVIDAGMDNDERAEGLKFDVVDIKVAALGYASWAQWQLGNADEAVRLSDEAMTVAKDIQHPFSIAFSICFASWTYAFCGDLKRVLELAEEAFALSKRYGFQFWIGWTEVMSAWSKARLTGTYDSGIKQVSAGIADWKDTRSRLGLSYFLYLQADLLSSHGDHDEALTILEDATRFCDETRERFWVPELLRLRGEILFAQCQANAKESERLFNSAASIASNSGMIALEFRALTSLARLQNAGHGTPGGMSELKKLLSKLQEGGVTSDQEEARRLFEKIEFEAGELKS
ncbi:ATP-binding protein [Roseovarius nanhaiticus]|uniref:ATP-binding protein n=1 Tax=Roseovarius nanhaiticus TaxID=573024 RepID=UPI0024905451|nr:adenylate/guanylate cyclase domain-containing protein [Roseovarius nanhaiticus]